MFIHLARPGFSCSMRDLWSSLRLTGFLVTASELLGLRSKESTCQCRTPGFNPWVRKIPWRRKWQPPPVFLENPMDRGGWRATVHGVAKSHTRLKRPSTVKVEDIDLGSIPGLGRSPGEGNDYLLQYSCLENSMDRGAWQAVVHGIAESDMTEWLILSAGCLGIRELITCKLHFPHL